MRHSLLALLLFSAAPAAAVATEPDFGVVRDGAACSPDDLGCVQLPDLAPVAHDLADGSPSDKDGAQAVADPDGAAADLAHPQPDDGVPFDDFGTAPDLEKSPDLAASPSVSGSSGCSVGRGSPGGGAVLLGALALLGLALRRRS